MPDPKNPGDRVQAHKLRKAAKLGALDPVHALWLEEYEEKQRKALPHAGSSPDVGASRSGRKINFQMEEQAEAVGTGNAAVAAASAALAVKEEGRRLDSLLMNAVDAMKLSADINRQTAVMLREDYGALFQLITERTQILEATHIEMLQTVRSYYIHAMHAEGALIARENEAATETDPATAMVVEMLAKKFGIDPKAAQLAAARAARKRPPLNGAAKQP